MRKAYALLLVALGLAQPVSAWERMLRSDCQVAFERLALLFGEPEERVLQMVQATRVTPDGWCQMKGGEPGLEEAQFDTLEWRAEEVTRWTRDGIPPVALALRMEGLDPDEMEGNGLATRRPPLSVDVVLRQIPEAGQVIVERAVMENAAGDALSFTGVFERLFLSSPSMTQVSVGSAALRAGLARMTLTGEVVDPFALDFDVAVSGEPDAVMSGVFGTISRLPAGVMDASSRAELTAFSGDLPDPVGTLEVSFASERGLGLMQLGVAAAMSLEAGMDPEAERRQAEILFDGVRLGVDWTPGAQVAD